MIRSVAAVAFTAITSLSVVRAWPGVSEPPGNVSTPAISQPLPTNSSFVGIASVPNTWCYRNYQGTNAVFKEEPGYTLGWGLNTIFSKDDPTTLLDFTFVRVADRTIYDRRIGWAVESTWVYEVRYWYPPARVTHTVEFLIHNEIEYPTGEVLQYAPELGRLPQLFVEGVEEVWIMKGFDSPGGGPRGPGPPPPLNGPPYGTHILIHNEVPLLKYQNMEAEVMLHEATHAGIDRFVYGDPVWEAAVQADNKYISRYAQQFPCQEDLAETFLLWVAVLFKPDRLDDLNSQSILDAMANRFGYLSAKFCNFYCPLFPMVDFGTLSTATTGPDFGPPAAAACKTTKKGKAGKGGKKTKESKRRL